MKLKRIRFFASIAFASLFGGGVGHAVQVQAPSPGDLFLGVRASGGQGAGSSYIVNIGNDTSFRNATPGSPLSLGNYSADLVALFGANWHTRNDLYWAVCGSRNQTNPVTYGTREQSPFGTPSSGFAPQNVTARSSTNSQLISVIDAYSRLDATANNTKAAVQTDAPNSASYNFQVATAGTTDFGSQSGWVSIEGSFSNGASQTALDLFRYFGNTGAGTSSVDYLGTFSITSLGELSFEAADKVQVVAQSVTVNENDGTVQVNFKRFGADLATPISATFAVTNGSAVAGTDYTTPPSLIANFLANQDTASVEITIADRVGYQGDRTFSVTLQSATGGYVVTSPLTTTVTIDDNELNPGTIAFSSATYSASVLDSSILIGLSRTTPEAGAGTVTVNVTVTGGSLTNGTHYTLAVPTTVTFAGDATTASTSIALSTALQGTITLGLSSLVNTTTASNPPFLGAQATATVNVTGVPGTLSFANASYSFPESAGTVNLPIVRTAGLQGEVSVQVTATPGTATAADYSLPSSPYTATLADGVSSVNVPLTLIADALSEVNETFTLTLSSQTGGAQLGTTTSTTIRINEFDSVAPKITLTDPAAAARLNNASVTVTGSFTDDKGVDRVVVRHNGVLVPNVTLGGSATSGTFTGSITAVAGPNTITVQAVDGTNNVSPIVSRSFTYVVTSSLVVTKTGDGTLTPLLGVNLPGTVPNAEIGKVYTITAKPGTGKLFAGWSGAGVSTTAAELAALTFTHQDGLTIGATFINNPFTPDVVGDFNGLIQHPTPSSRSLASEGFITVNVTNTGAFSGTLRIDGTSTSLRGALNTSGVARFGATRTETLVIPRPGKSSLVVQFSVDLNPAGTKKLTGTVAQQSRTGTTALANIDANRAPYKAASSLPTPRQGTFNFVLPSQAQTNGLTAEDYPQGDGIGSVTISATGLASFKGNLADGTPFTASAFLSNVSGNIDKVPFFAQPYANNGAIAGSVVVNIQPDSDLSSSSVLWFKPVSGGHYYPFGWLEGVTTTLTGSKFTATANASVIPGLPGVNPLTGNATLEFSDGGLDETLSKDVNISATNGVTKVPVTNPSYALTIAPKTGDISGSFEHSDGSRPKFTGKVIQKGTNGGAYGYFLTIAPKVATGEGKSGGVSLNHK